MKNDNQKHPSGTTEDVATDVDLGVARTLQGLATAAEDMEGVDSAKAEQMGEELMEEMMKEFENMGEKKDFDGIGTLDVVVRLTNGWWKPNSLL